MIHSYTHRIIIATDRPAPRLATRHSAHVINLDSNSGGEEFPTHIATTPRPMPPPLQPPIPTPEHRIHDTATSHSINRIGLDIRELLRSEGSGEGKSGESSGGGKRREMNEEGGQLGGVEVLHPPPKWRKIASTLVQDDLADLVEMFETNTAAADMYSTIDAPGHRLKYVRKLLARHGAIT